MQLRVESLTLVRGPRVLVRGLSFALAAGEALVLEGPNGAGKTTLLRTIAGFLAPTAGTIRLDGGAPGAPSAVKAATAIHSDFDATIAERCHVVGHANAVKPSLTAAENLAFWARYLGAGAADATSSARAADGAHSDAAIRAAVDAALDRLGIAALADIPAGFFSAGQRRRLALARLLVAKRPLWLLDEPSVSLDAEGTAALAALVREHIAAGGLAIVATHIDFGLAGARRLMLARPAAEAA